MGRFSKLTYVVLGSSLLLVVVVGLSLVNKYKNQANCKIDIKYAEPSTDTSVLKCGVKYVDISKTYVYVIARIKRIYVKNDMALMQIDYGLIDQTVSLGKLDRDKALFKEKKVAALDNQEHITAEDYKVLSTKHVSDLASKYTGKLVEFLFLLDPGDIQFSQPSASPIDATMTTNILYTEQQAFWEQCRQSIQKQYANVYSHDMGAYVIHTLYSLTDTSYKTCANRVTTVTVFL